MARVGRDSDSEANSVRAFFDAAAGGYRERRYGPAADPWRAHFFGGRLGIAREFLGPAPARVLDLGSGPGVLDLPGGSVVRLDLSEAMLRAAPGSGVAGDATRVPLADGSFDAVLALGLTTYLPRLDEFLAECRRVLRPGGRLVFTVTRRAAPDTILRALYRATAGRLGGGGGLLSAGLRLRTFSGPEVSRALRRAGFCPLDSRPHNHTVFPFCYLLRGPSLRIARALDGRAPWLASDLVVLAERAAALPPPPPRRVVRLIARLNVGGPARQAILLSRGLPPKRYETTLVTGRVAEGEADMLGAARAAGIEPVVLADLGRRLSPLSDLRAFLGVLRALRRARPHILHTHTAKAGALGRLAGALLGVPARVHTFHGHVLSGYFGRIGAAAVRAAELLLARLSTRIVAVSPEVREDLVRRFRIAPPEKVCVVPLGFDLTPFAKAGPLRGALRRDLGIPAEAPVVAVVGRITAIKEPLLAVETARRVLATRPETRFLFVGGGEMLPAVRSKVTESGLEGRVLFAGFREDMAGVFADTDVALLTSRNEGTPVALIEAAAAGVPAVATRVGGVPFVVEHGRTGLLAKTGDADGLARAVLELLGDRAQRLQFGAAAREKVLGFFTADRLISDIEALYQGRDP
jgi:glycosyltransferase involved in cell wall biosynthesis